MSNEQIDIVVIGAGQAGLAVGYYLARQRCDFVIVDAGDRVGQSWDTRWDSLRLFTPAHFTRLPGLRFPGPRRYLPSKDDMADYLRSYAARFALPVRLRWRVDQLSRDDDGFLVCSAGRTLRADTVVVATGPAMRPWAPDVADQLDPAIRSLHSADYRNPEQLHDGAVLVVGAGNSGAEIALEVAPTHEVVLAGRDTGRIPISLGGPIYRVMNQVLTANTRLGRRFAASVHKGKGTPLVRVRPADLTAAGVERAPRVDGQVDGCPRLEDGRVLDVANVIWCTGYRPDYSWIALPEFPRDGLPIHHRGAVLDQPGLYVIGLPFLFRMASSLVGGVGPDARHIAHLIERDLEFEPLSSNGQPTPQGTRTRSSERPCP
jgi:putative flavoprotein involved in K+ transport